MKDAKHHLKHLQKKVMKEMKKEPPNGSTEPVVLAFTRPKVLQNRRKLAQSG